MSHLSMLREKLKNRETVTGSMIGAAFDITLPEKFKKNNFDFLIFDAEHGQYNVENVSDLLYICRLIDMPSIVRVTDSTYSHISKAVDMGADGVLIPRTESPGQVEMILNALRFYPKGKKGAGGRGLFRAGETQINEINENRMLFLQIESPEGVNNLDEILDKYGSEVEGIIIGPCDMSIMCGCGLDTGNDKVVNCIKETVKICRKHEKSAGMFMLPDNAKTWLDEGMNILWAGSEGYALEQGIRQMAKTILNAQK